jgi:hypothetical protein
MKKHIAQIIEKERQNLHRQEELMIQALTLYAHLHPHRVNEATKEELTEKIMRFFEKEQSMLEEDPRQFLGIIY